MLKNDILKGFSSFSLLFSYCQKANFEFGMNKKVKSVYLTTQKFTTSKPILHVGLKKAQKTAIFKLENDQNQPIIIFFAIFFANLIRFMVEF